ncbi:hypothetical protein OJF2_05860 [Aquisphaera giovannonii]|uniref:Uncharacterized protein n=1 Tax=Aquisphaera giovannonii TaxID=406548 RepID=A0A5B9VVZ5_9BACT|nr:hypothetical protein OJF2_05860 [Aquisphaera giovannonii]
MSIVAGLEAWLPLAHLAPLLLNHVGNNAQASH